VPVPVVVVEKVTDKELPSYGDAEPQTLSTDVSKRTAGAEPDFETTKEESPVAAPPVSPDVPRVVVEKADNRLDYGDDFGDNATTSQKVAPHMRAADASLNELVLPNDHVEPTTEEDQAAPLFRHESFQADEAQSIDEVSDQSSIENTSSGDAIHTPSELEQSQGDHESNTDPLFSHETGSANGDFDELNHGPLLSHETGPNGDDSSSDEYEDELDAAPLLPHETGFSSYAGSRNTTNSDYTEDDISEPRHYMYGDDDDLDEYRARSIQPDEAPTFTHEDLPNGEVEHYEEHDTPLLPHERDFAIPDRSSPEEDGLTFNSRPTFGYETDSAKNIFGGTGRPGIFRKRTHSSSLPHSMPQTDAEDENLLDPSLERFPTSRERILDRVATIGLHLPEDQTMEEHIHSPVMSVLSQACSSVDLVPVKSYISLASVAESDEDDEEVNGDIHSLPSPVVSHFSSASPRFARDPHATPLPDDSKRLGFAENQIGQAQVDRSVHSSEAESVPKTDGTKEPVLVELQDVIASSNQVLNPITPPLTPEKSNTSSTEDVAQVPEAQLRRRQVLQESLPKDSLPSSPKADTFVEGDSNGPGSVGRFLTACIGDRKRAG
jgi:hypothetical protein